MSPTLSTLETYEEVLRAGSDIHHHLPFLFEHAKGNVMEIGVRQGASTAALLAGIAEHGGHLWSVDKIEWNIFPENPDWTFIQADSAKMASTIKRIIPSELDLLLIDGDHSYDAVLSDLDNYGARAKLIALHDAEAHSVLTAISDYCYRQELDYEIRHHSFGLGVIRK